MDKIEESINIADRKITLQIGKLARSADISVYGRLGDTCVLVTVCVGGERTDIDYFPLYVEYVEKLYAGGKIKGSRWVKREGRPSDEAVLTARLIDRSVRPLFPKNYRKEVQLVITLLSVDGVNSPEIVSAIAASCALHLSPVPWRGPISTIRIGHIKDNRQEKGTYFINPIEEEQQFSQLDLLVSSTEDKVVMIETQAEEIDESIILQGVEIAMKENKKIISFINSLREKAGLPKEEVEERKVAEEIAQTLRKKYSDTIKQIAIGRKEEQKEAEIITATVDEVYQQFREKTEKKEILAAINKLVDEKIRGDILKKKKRIDGRGPDQIRDIYIETSVLPRTHGSALFQRGQTQVLSVATLGSLTLEQLIESPEGEESKRYIHHYYMPPYSMGEVGRLGWSSRREIGHGALAEKALEPLLSSEEEFPYAVRVVSEILSSNGSTSMAAVCGSSLALMDAGVPIKSAAAGISIGLVYKSEEEYVLLTDIIGLEDFAGDMDFKVAGTKNGITAIQLDVKNEGISKKIVEEALDKASKARLFILDKMNQVIKQPMKELSKYAPKIVVLIPPSDKIGEIIGPGGKTIRQIIARTQTDIDVREDGKVSISGPDKEAVDKAAEIVKSLYQKIEVEQEFEGEIKRILSFGAFVEILPGKEGLIHVSQMGKGYIRDPRDVVSVGQKVKVKVNKIDHRGRINLTLLNKK